MNTKLFIVLTYCVSITLFSLAAVAKETATTNASSWEPGKTWVMMVGVEEGKHNKIYADMPDPNREDQKLHDLFIERGVPKNQIVFLKDEKATLATIKTTFTELLKKTNEGDTLFVYYTGHGTADKNGHGYFANYDAKSAWSSLWAVADIYAAIEADFKGNTVLTMGDCCYSGTLSTQMKALKTDKAYATVSSSLSTTTAGMYWTFTETLISAFRGRAYVDSDADGHVSITELGSHSREEVGVFMNQETTFASNDAFPQQFNLVASQKRAHNDVGEYREVRIDPSKDKWQKAKIVKVDGNDVTLLYYFDDEANYKTFAADSEHVRSFSQEPFEATGQVQVKDGRRWYPAEIVSVDAETGLHKVRYGKRKQWDGLFFRDDLRAGTGRNQ
jgi:hypothetical protein